ncbi:hypothetical protein DVH24_014612 [Malus domestica]|uniref:Uncharacterized protein n=1 Tax=Malus domestica TaxID=3750 RepID=A0A498KKR2_MALDO|nr:hypothetical protein DVH24_014612 [Malus domestica]
MACSFSRSGVWEISQYPCCFFSYAFHFSSLLPSSLYFGCFPHSLFYSWFCGSPAAVKVCWKLCPKAGARDRYWSTWTTNDLFLDISSALADCSPRYNSLSLLHDFQHGVEFVAEHVLPLLIPLLIDQQLNVQQFAKYMLFVKDIVRTMLDFLKTIAEVALGVMASAFAHERNSHVALIKLYMAMIRYCSSPPTFCTCVALIYFVF